MAAYDTLRAAIDSYIKANGNKEITGTVLNDILNAMVSALGADTRFAGVAVPTTNPGNPEGNVVYFASQAGTYSNFGGIVLPLGIHILVWNGTVWTSQTWFSVDNTPTQNSQNLATSGGILQAIVDAVGVERLRAIGAEVTSCSFDGTTKKISFFNSADDTLFQLDATAFVIDGMVSDVKIEDGNLVIQFNTDAGKQDIEIPLTDIFNPANYYTKTAIDALLALYYTKTETDALLTAINNKLADGCLYRGMAEPTTNPPTPTTKVFYIATKAGTYTNFGNIAVTEGITILKYDGSNWSKEQISYSDGVFDISAYNGTSYADLSAALGTNGANIPENLRKGGMSVKFVQSSDNKYVQYMYMLDDATDVSDFTNTANWQGVDDVPTAGSDNLVKSGGVFPTVNAVNKALIPITGNVSIIGDSISTFNGTMPSGYITYYPQQSLGVTSLYDMWWHLLLSMTDSKLEVNASWSGSRVTNGRSGEGYPDFYDRTNILGSPDYIFVELGTNDSTYSVPLGDYDYDSQNLSESEFIPAYIKGVKALKANYSNAKIVLFVFQMADSYANAIKNIGKHYELNVIDVRSYYKNNVHPNKLQMCSVAQTINSFYIRGKVDDEPTAGSDNLVKSGGVYNIFLPKNLKERYIIDSQGDEVPYGGGEGNINYACTGFYPVVDGETFSFTAVNSVFNVAYYDANKVFVRRDSLSGITSSYTLDFSNNSKIVYARFNLYAWGGNWAAVNISADQLLPYMPLAFKAPIGSALSELGQMEYSTDPLIRISQTPAITETGSASGSITVNFGSAIFYFFGKTLQYINFATEETKSFTIAHSRAMYYDITNNKVVIKTDNSSYPSNSYILLADCYNGRLSSGFLKTSYNTGLINNKLNTTSKVSLLLSNYGFEIKESRTPNGSVVVTFPANETGFLKYLGVSKSILSFNTSYTVEHNEYLYIDLNTCEITIETTILNPNEKLLLLMVHNGLAVDGKLKELYNFVHEEPNYDGERILIGQKNTYKSSIFVTLSEFGVCQGCALYDKYLFVAMSTADIWVFDITTGEKVDSFASGSGIHFNTMCFGNELAPNSAFPYLYCGSWNGDRGIHVFSINGSVGELSCTDVQSILFTNVSSTIFGLGETDFGIDFANNKLYTIAYDSASTQQSDSKVCIFDLPEITGTNVVMGDNDVKDNFTLPEITTRQGCLFDGTHLYVLRGYGDSELVAIDVNAKRISARVRMVREGEAEGLAIYDNKLLVVRSNMANIEQITF